MKTSAASRLARWGALPLLMMAFVACARGEKEDSVFAQELAVAPSGQGGESPPLRGSGGDTHDAAVEDTIDLRAIGYSRGSANAPIRIYEFSDFGCPFCRMFARGTYRELHEEFVETGKVRWTYVPIVTGMFRNGAETARAAECAGEQGRFWEMHDLLYEKQREWSGDRRPDRLYERYAVEVGLDATRFASCYRENRGAERTSTNNRAASALGVRATPTFLINGRLVEGAPPTRLFRQLLNSLLAEGTEGEREGL